MKTIVARIRKIYVVFFVRFDLIECSFEIIEPFQHFQFPVKKFFFKVLLWYMGTLDKKKCGYPVRIDTNERRIDFQVLLRQIFRYVGITIFNDLRKREKKDPFLLEF